MASRKVLVLADERLDDDPPKLECSITANGLTFPFVCTSFDLFPSNVPEKEKVFQFNQVN